MKGIEERLRQIRKELGINQGKFAERIGLKQGSYSDIENGKEILTPRSLKLICHEFGINEDWLSNGTGEIFRSMELAPDEKDLLAVYEKLEPTGRKQVRDYAAERLELQLFKRDVNRAWDEGAGAAKQALESTTRPPEAPQGAEPEESTG